jgi:hypothetical protein
VNDFLDAECVINALFEKGILARKVWKLSKGTADNYSVNFEFVDSARIAGFLFYIKGTYHCVGKTALKNVASRFNLPIDDIFIQCVIT